MSALLIYSEVKQQLIKVVNVCLEVSGASSADHRPTLVIKHTMKNSYAKPLRRKFYAFYLLNGSSLCRSRGGCWVSAQFCKTNPMSAFKFRAQCWFRSKTAERAHSSTTGILTRSEIRIRSCYRISIKFYRRYQKPRTSRHSIFLLDMISLRSKSIHYAQETFY